jgi:ABC-type dipeptide/oligopeptide/nickel transport system permease subunit
MLRFLLFPAVLAVVAYATLGGADLSDIIKFGVVLLIALCTAIIYARAARAKHRSDDAR